MSRRGGAVETHRGTIHLLPTDVVTPGMNGRESAARVEAIRPGIRTLFASAHTSDLMLRHGALESGQQCIAKPYTPHTLAAKIRAVLDAGWKCRACLLRAPADGCPPHGALRPQVAGS